MSHVTPKNQGRDLIIFVAAIKLFNFYHWPTQLTYLTYMDFTVSYQDASDRLHVRLNSILLQKRRFSCLHIVIHLSTKQA